MTYEIGPKKVPPTPTQQMIKRRRFLERLGEVAWVAGGTVAGFAILMWLLNLGGRIL